AEAGLARRFAEDLLPFNSLESDLIAGVIAAVQFHQQTYVALDERNCRRRRSIFIARWRGHQQEREGCQRPGWRHGLPLMAQSFELCAELPAALAFPGHLLFQFLLLKCQFLLASLPGKSLGL